MLTELVPALLLVICTDGYQCIATENRNNRLLAQPSFELCLENIKAMPTVPSPYSESENFTVIPTCVMVSPDKIEW